MRVLLVVGRSAGGIGTHVSQLRADLEDLGVECRLVTDATTSDHFGWHDARRWWPDSPSALVRWRGRLREAARSADVVHAHGLQAGLAVSAALAGGPRVPVARTVLSLHNPPPVGGRLGAMAGAVAAVAVRRPDLVTGASDDLVATARRLGARDARLAPVPSPLVPGLLDRPVPSAAERARRAVALGLGDGRPVLLTVARVAPQKRLDLVVAAAAQMRHGSEVVWAVAGGGDRDELAHLEEAARGSAVRFLGPRADVVDLFGAATALVVTSDWEARALVVQEAMAAGVPVVATAVGGLPGLLEGTGTLVPPSAPSALAAALDDLLADRGAVAAGRRVATAREVAATWDDGPSAARRWVRWYAESRR